MCPLARPEPVSTPLTTELPGAARPASCRGPRVLGAAFDPFSLSLRTTGRPCPPPPPWGEYGKKHPCLHCGDVYYSSLTAPCNLAHSPSLENVSSSPYRHLTFVLLRGRLCVSRDSSVAALGLRGDCFTQAVSDYVVATVCQRHTPVSRLCNASESGSRVGNLACFCSIIRVMKTREETQRPLDVCNR